MKTEPRRRERSMKSRRDMELLLERMPVGRLAVMTGEGPYVVALNYLFFEGAIYFHSALAGRKIEALRADPRVCFLVDDPGPQVLWEQGCGISQIYRSVICFGTAGFVEEPEEKRRILEKMIRKFVPAHYSISPLNDPNLGKTAVVKIAVESMNGKENPLSSLHTVLPGPLAEAKAP